MNQKPPGQEVVHKLCRQEFGFFFDPLPPALWKQQPVLQEKRHRELGTLLAFLSYFSLLS